MTEKRFVDYFDKDHNYIIQDLQNEDEYQVGFVNCDEDVFLELINQLSDENEQLKTQLQNTCDQRDEFHRGARENANRVGKLEKENEQLKQENQSWLKTVSRLDTIVHEDRDYAKRMHKENEQLKAQLNDCEKRVIDKEVEWLRNNTVWEVMPSSRRTYTKTSDDTK